ncbi:MAG: allantoate amidohydrolase [Acidobacteriota bacterium]
MKRKRFIRRHLVPVLGVAMLLAAFQAPAHADDWPEWRGSGRQGVWTEDGVLTRFPPAGLSYTWRVPVHEGYAGPSVSAGRVFVTDFVREAGIHGIERALCLDEKTGKLLWRQTWKVDYAGTQPTWASGPCATPTVSSESVYIMGGMSRLLALDTSTGEVRWQHDLVEDYAATVPGWGAVSAPLVYGKLLIALVGGENNALVVAFDKDTGKEVWRALPSGGDPGYAPPLMVHAGGVDQLIIWHPRAVSSLDPRTGEVYWEQPFEVRMALTIATPVFDGHRLLVSAFYDGSMMLELAADKPAARKLWQIRGNSEQPADTRALHALIATPVLDGDFIYGIDSYGELRGLRAASGERIWESLDLTGEHARWATALRGRHGDRYFNNNDRGELVMARLTPEGYEEMDRTPLIEPTSRGGGRRELGAVLWSHPAYANRHIVVRNDREIVRASLAATPPAQAAPTSPSSDLRVDAERLKARLAQLGTFGANPEGGVSRVAFSDADLAGRDYLMELMRQAGLGIRIDAAGNIIGHRAGSDPALAPILFGSHADSVPNGGNYDGQVGVLTAIEVAQVLQEHHMVTRHPLEVIIFADEEGGLIGSKSFVGHLAEAALAEQSHAGFTIGEGIRRLGGDPKHLDQAGHKPGEYAAFLEMHIEQGGVLDGEGVDIGVVTGIVGIDWWDMYVEGMANHAGTTPMDRRQDALVAAARLILAVQDVITSEPGAQVGTVGRIHAEPGAPNVIPGRVVASLEIRDLSDARILDLFARIKSAADEIARATGTTISFRKSPIHEIAAATDGLIRDTIAAVSAELGYSHKRMPSGAGHDAQAMATIMPMGMIFVPSAGGISHSPKEFSSPQAVAKGAHVLLHTILALDRKQPPPAARP